MFRIQKKLQWKSKYPVPIPRSPSSFFFFFKFTTRHSILKHRILNLVFFPLNYICWRSFHTKSSKWRQTNLATKGKINSRRPEAEDFVVFTQPCPDQPAYSCGHLDAGTLKGHWWILPGLNKQPVCMSWELWIRKPFIWYFYTWQPSPTSWVLTFYRYAHLLVLTICQCSKNLAL